MDKIITQINEKVAQAKSNILTFFRQIVAIPSMDSDIGDLCKGIKVKTMVWHIEKGALVRS